MAEAPRTGADARALREELQLTQAALGRLLEVSSRMIRKIEAAETIPAGYLETYASMAVRRRPVAPKRSRTKVRAKGGGTQQVTPPKAGTDLGVVFARGTGPDAPVVRVTSVWVPYTGINDKLDAHRTVALGSVADAVAEAHRLGLPAVLTAHRPDQDGRGGELLGPRGGHHRGGRQAGYDLRVRPLLPGERRPPHAVVIGPGDDVDLADLDRAAELADIDY